MPREEAKSRNVKRAQKTVDEELEKCVLYKEDPMKKTMSVLIVLAVLAAFGASEALAQTSQPAAKFTATVSNVTLIPMTAGPMDWTTVLKTTIKTPNKKDLLIGGSFETALYTQTQVKSRNGTTDTSSASATLEVRLLIDGSADYAYPHWVVYDKRAQTLSATLGGVIQSCQDLNGDGIITVATECIVTDEMINLILETMAAHHYNFVAANLSSGVHSIEIQCRIGTISGFTAGTASAMAGVGRGSLTVEQVRATNLPDGITFLQ
jgi:hypothetical protein